MVANYTRQIHALVQGGVDILLAETSFDTLVFKACLFAIDQYFAEHDIRLPVMLSGTIFDSGRTLSAQSVEAFYYSIAHFDSLTVGLNCALGVEQMRPYLETLAGLAQADQLLSQRRLARRLRRLQGLHRRDGQDAGGIRGQRLAQYRGRLLRHDARMDSRDRPGRRRHQATHSPGGAGLVVLQRHRAPGDSSRVQLHHGRRAHQHHRLAPLRPPHQGRQLRGSRQGRPRASRGWRQHPRHQHGRRPRRRQGGDDQVL